MSVFSDNFESGTLAAWDSTTGAVSVIDDPTGGGHGKVLQCDCSAGDAYLTKNLDSLGLTAPWTISFDVYIPASTQAALEAASDNSTADFTEFNDGIYSQNRDGWKWRSDFGGTGIPTIFGAWHHVVVVFDGTSDYWTIDGTPLALNEPSPDTSAFNFGAIFSAGADGEIYYLDNAEVDEGGCVPPLPSFTYTNAGNTVTFTDTSLGSPTSWSWDLGDGNTSTDQNPVETYPSSKCWTVTLTATNECGSNTFSLVVNTNTYDTASGNWTNQAGTALTTIESSLADGVSSGDMTVLDDTPYVAVTGPGTGPFLFQWNGTDWTDLGSPVSGALGISRFGVRVCTDGTDIFVAYLEALSDLSGLTAPATCYVYKWDGSSWTLLGSITCPFAPATFDQAFYEPPAIDLSADPVETGACYVALSDSVQSSSPDPSTGSRVVVKAFGASSLGTVSVESAGPDDGGAAFTGKPLLDGAGTTLALYYLLNSAAPLSDIQVWTPGGTGSIAASQFQSDYSGALTLTSPDTIANPAEIGRRPGDTIRYLLVLVETSGHFDAVMKAINISVPFTVGHIDTNPAHDYNIGGTANPPHGIIIEPGNFWVADNPGGSLATVRQLDRQCPGLDRSWITTFSGSTFWNADEGDPVIATDLYWRFIDSGIVVNRPICRGCQACTGCGGGLHVWVRFAGGV